MPGAGRKYGPDPAVWVDSLVTSTTPGACSRVPSKLAADGAKVETERVRLTTSRLLLGRAAVRHTRRVLQPHLNNEQITVAESAHRTSIVACNPPIGG